MTIQSGAKQVSVISYQVGFLISHLKMEMYHNGNVKISNHNAMNLMSELILIHCHRLKGVSTFISY